MSNATTGENAFRVALAVVMILTMAVTLYHRMQAAATGERVSHKAEGYVFAGVLRLAGLGLWTSTFAYLLFPASVRWASFQAPAWLRWTATAAGAACALLMYWTLSSLGKNLTDTVATRADAFLITHGPYRLVRHPFYVTAALLMASATLIAANWMIALMSLLVLALLAARTPKEEEMLIKRFGQPYRDYMLSTGRFFPRIFRLER
jgi:protein-S-isoprenylcysteine O-methyltransferase Ste14